MANKVKHVSSTVSGNLPPAGAPADRGRLAIQLADKKIWAYDVAGQPVLITQLVGDHNPSVTYQVGDVAVRDRVLYRCVNPIGPRAFTPSDWETVSDFRGELLYREPTLAAQARMAIGDPTIGARVRANAAQTAAVAAWEDGAGNTVSDIRPDAYPGAAFGRPVFRVDQVAHGFTAVGQPVRFNGTNWVLAQAGAAGGAAAAVVHRVLNVNAVELQVTGRVDGLQVGAFEGGVIAANTQYYVSVANPGRLTSSPPPDETEANAVLRTLDDATGVITLQIPVGVPQFPDLLTVSATQSPNPFATVGLVAAHSPSGWALASNTGPLPVGIVSATAGNDFQVAFSGLITGIAAASAVAFPLVAGTLYYVDANGRLTVTVPAGGSAGAAPVLLATGADSGVIVTQPLPAGLLRGANNLSDLGNAGTARTNLGLGSAATATVTTSPTDTTAGRLLKVGDFGLGAAVNCPTIADMDDTTLPSGLYRVIASTSNRPANLGTVEIRKNAATRITQEFRELLAGDVGGALLIREHFDGTWSAWRTVYTNRNILGTVSQSGGVPTGAVIQRGGNANGQFVRFADGTQICYCLAAANQTCDEAIGNGFRGDADIGFTYPAAFSANPYVVPAGRYVSGSASWTVPAAGASTGGTSARLYSFVTGAVGRPGVIAMGTWF